MKSTTSPPPEPMSEDSLFTVGLPGQHLYIDRYIRPDDPSNSLTVFGGEPGDYKVVFTLSRPGFALHPEYELHATDNLKGDSHLAITPPALVDPLVPDANRIHLAFEIPSIGNIEFTGYPNDEGYLGKIDLNPISSEGFTEAEETAYYLLAPLLSYYSTYLDIPLYVYQVDITELRTGSMRISFINPSPGAPLLLVPSVGINNEWRGYASLYREALNSNSPIYQFLCLYKIIEGVKERHARVARETKARSERFSRDPLIIPRNKDDQIIWLNQIFPTQPEWDDVSLKSIFVEESVNRRFSNIDATILYPLRNDIAHALFSNSGELTVSIDEAFHLRKIHKWLPLTKCLVRWLLKNEFPSEFSFSPARPFEIS